MSADPEVTREMPPGDNPTYEQVVALAFIFERMGITFDIDAISRLGVVRRKAA